MSEHGLPSQQGLYDPRFEHDACGVGFLADLHGRKSNVLFQKALEALRNMKHRGASGCEPNTGDGAGILIQTPHRFLARACNQIGIRLPDPGAYGVGTFFLPRDTGDHRTCQGLVEQTVLAEGQKVLGWRTVPTDNRALGASARRDQPLIRQLFVKRHEGLADEWAFERRLYIIRKLAERAVKNSALAGRDAFYVSSLSCRTLLYKGMLTAGQLPEFYPDLVDPEVETALALIHSRFSTNTFPSWARAHPYRYLAHNGEINTLRGNVNWMHARESLFSSAYFGPDLAKILPVIDPDGSDSAMLDNVLEMLVLTGRSLAHGIMMLVPEPWNSHQSMSAHRRAFYEYHACLMEPWDGPASIVFTDGLQVGAVLDRNGLRPARYCVTTDGLVIMASEAGVLDIPVDKVIRKGRLQPGRLLLVDLEQGKIQEDDEVKERIAGEKPYHRWVEETLISLEDLPSARDAIAPGPEQLAIMQRAFGYTSEELNLLMKPMAREGSEALGSMGTDTPLAVLSNKPLLLYNYFQQLFAQVTNPPVDAIREELVMSMATTVGAEGNLLDLGHAAFRQIKLPAPILTNEELTKIRGLERTVDVHIVARADGFRSITLAALFPVAAGGAGLDQALADLCRQAATAITQGVNLIILSDRGIDRDNAGIPALLAIAGVHHHLIRQGLRTRAGLILETAEPREVHHFALLIGYGAGAINPYLVFDSLDGLIRDGHLLDVDYPLAARNFKKAVNKGVIKVMSKMGIATVQSYCGAQIFETIGINREIVDRYFTGTASRVGGIGLEEIAREVSVRHRLAFPARAGERLALDGGGHYQWREDGEIHLFNPQTVHKLQLACRTGKYHVFQEYSALVNEQAGRLCTLRGLFALKLAATPVPLDEVESVELILKRFKSGAMSYGSISQEAHETLAIAMNRIGGKSNTGEGGEDPARYTPDANGDSRNSAIKQVASARFGVTSEYLVMARELQIKMAQGAKPGEGGQLPGHKVYPWIARVRHSTPGVGLISPPPHHDIYSIEDLAELIHDLKNANPEARVSVKLVSEVGVGTIAAGVAKAKADVVLISGHDGGTGAAPLTSIKHAGAPWELGLAETHQVLLLNGLRDRIAVEVDGQLKTGRDVVIAALLGAEEFGFATAPLVALGCVMMRVCHLNTCPVGVATQDPTLRKNFTGDPVHVVHFMRFIAQEVRELMAQLGFRTLNEMVGHTECLQTSNAIDHFKTRGLDFSRIFYQPDIPAEMGRFCQVAQDHGLETSLDQTTLLPLCAVALRDGMSVEAHLPIRNIHRVVGTRLGSEITRRFGRAGLPEDTVRLHFTGTAGQSFGAFIPRGLTLRLEGDANDYVGKGLSGGKIIVFPPADSRFVPEENVIIGNVALYGATSGEAYFRGLAGERFAVRNSGALAVVEGVGDHGCEYMTAGRVVVLGPTGRNFAAGMSGGIAYVLDMAADFSEHCNQTMVGLTHLTEPEDQEQVLDLIRRHARATGSLRAWKILALWDEFLPRFVKVYPNDYRRIMETLKGFRAEGLSEDEAEMAAFERHARD